MSFDSLFNVAPKKKPATSCAGALGSAFALLMLSIGIIRLVAYLVWAGVDGIIRDGWSFWNVARLTVAVWIVGGWFGKAKR